MRWAWLMVVTGLVTACTAVPSASPSAAEPSATTAPLQAGFPPGCGPVDLRSPTGERIDLTGEWAGSGILTGESESAWLQQIGDCVYGSVVGSVVIGIENERIITISNLSGRVGLDFRIGFETVIFAQPPITAGTYSPMVMRIEWDADGRIRLREDRESAAGRCIEGYCPDPVIWYRIDEAPPS